MRKQLKEFVKKQFNIINTTRTQLYILGQIIELEEDMDKKIRLTQEKLVLAGEYDARIHLTANLVDILKMAQAEVAPMPGFVDCAEKIYHA